MGETAVARSRPLRSAPHALVQQCAYRPSGGEMTVINGASVWEQELYDHVTGHEERGWVQPVLGGARRDHRLAGVRLSGPHHPGRRATAPSAPRRSRRNDSYHGRIQRRPTPILIWVCSRLIVSGSWPRPSASGAGGGGQQEPGTAGQGAEGRAAHQVMELVVRLMQQDNEKHRCILEFIRDRPASPGDEQRTLGVLTGGLESICAPDGPTRPAPFVLRLVARSGVP